MYAERRSAMVRATLWRARQSVDAAVLPDGCMDVLWLHDQLVVAGPDTRPQRAGSADQVVGLRFDPGVAPGLLGVPADALRDSRVPLTDLWPAGRVRRWVSTVRADGPLVALERLAATDGNDDGQLGELAHIARLCACGCPSSTVADAIGWSERTLHRRCLTGFGYGSKTLVRVLRFQRAAAQLRSGRAPAEVAATAGYADQAHLTREVSALSGRPPTKLIKVSAS